MRRHIFCFLLILAALPATADHRRTVAVIDFQNVNKDKNLDWLGTGIAETLTTHLSRLSQITVVERSRLQNALKEIKFNRSEFVDPSTATRLGKIIGADSIVLGSYQKFEDQIRLAARLVEVETGRVVAPTSIDGTYQKIFELQDALAGNLSKEIKGSVAPVEIAEIPRPATVDTYQLFSDGVYFLRNDLLQDALAQFDKALERDPNYAEAHFYRGLTLSRLKRWEDAAAALKRALPRSQPVRNIKWNWDVPYEGRSGQRGFVLVMDEKALGFAEHFSKEGSMRTTEEVIYTEKSGNSVILHMVDLRRRAAQRLAFTGEIPLNQLAFGNPDLLVLQGEVPVFFEPPYKMPIFLISPAENRVVARAQVEVKSVLTRPWPLVRKDTLYMFFFLANTARALDPTNGRLKWERTDLSLLEPWGFTTDPQLGELIVIKSKDKKVHVIRNTDGSDVWTADLLTADAFITVSEGVVAVLEHRRRVAAYDVRTGRVIAESGTLPAATWIDLAPGLRLRVVPTAMRNKVLYFAADDKNLAAMNVAADSKSQDRVRWKVSLGKDVYSIRARGERVYIGTDSGELIVLDAASGRSLASTKVAKKDLIIEEVDDEMLLARSGSSVFAFDPSTGMKRWEYVGKFAYPEPQRFKNVVLLRPEAHQLSVLDTATGNVLWQYVGKRHPFVYTTADSLFIAEETGIREYAVEAKAAPGLADKEVFTELAGVLVQQANYEEAGRILEKVTREIDSEYPPARYLKAKVLAAKGQRHAAAQELVSYVDLVGLQSQQAQTAIEELKRDHGLIWRSRLDAPVPFEPKEIQGRVVSTGLRISKEPQIVALELDGGKIAWRYPGRRFLSASRSADPGQVLYATGDESDQQRIYLYSVAAATGERRELASVTVPGGGIGRTVASDKYVYLHIAVADFPNQKASVVVHAFDGITGGRLWEKTFESTSAAHGTPVIAWGDYIAIGVDKDLVVLRGADGQEHARHREASGFHDNVSVSPDGILYFATADNTVVAYDLPRKNVVARLKLTGVDPGQHASARWNRDETLYDYDGQSVYAVDLRRDTPRVKWRLEAESDRRFEGLYLGERLLVIRDDRIVQELDPATGTIRQEHSLFWDSNGILARGDTAFVLSSQGDAYAFRFRPGK